MIKRLFILTTLSALAVGLLGPAPKISAVTSADWRAGQITDDVIFTNKDAMSVADIQNFLNQKVGTTQANGTPGVCDTNGVKPSEFGGGTRAQWGAAHGAPAPYTCLKDYYEVPKTTPGPGLPASNYGGAAIPSGAISAAQIIYNAAQQYSISPKVLLTVLQKESVGPLVTDDWPTASQYVHPMGAHCPDSGSCDPNYFGFSMQIYESARLFRSYLDNMEQPWWGCMNGSGAKIQCAANAQGGSNPGAGYKVPYTTDFILWNPNTSCGGANISMSNKSTAALYMYTPYQPNGAALANMYGSGDSCSAYGNRNFWRMFSDWFGSTYAPTYSWSNGWYRIQDANNNDVDPGHLLPGDTYTVTLQAQNTGNSTWTNSGANPITLATSNPTSRMSSLCNSTWIACNRPTYLTEASVAPGSSGHFTFKIQTPYASGTYQESFKPVAENLGWFNDSPPNDIFGITVVSPGTYSYSTTGYAIMDASKTTFVDPGLLQPGQQYVAIASATNTGTATWYQGGGRPVHLATSNPTSRMSSLCNSTWIACNRPAGLTESSVAPGQTGHFEFTFQAPYVLGSYGESFRPVAEMYSWFNDAGQNSGFGIHVVSPGTFTWSTTGYVVKDQSGTQVNAAQLHAGQAYTATLPALNTGTATWFNSGPTPIHLATSNPTSRMSSLCNDSWMACNRPVGLTESSVTPGQTGHFTFSFVAPTKLGPDREWFKPVAENLAWFNDAPFNEVGIVVIP